MTFPGPAATVSVGDQDFLLIEMLRDGNCLYRALSAAITGTQDRHAEVRARVVGYITDEDKWDWYLNYVKVQFDRLCPAEAPSPTWRAGYAQYMGRTGTFGTVEELRVARSIFHFNYRIVEWDGDRFGVIGSSDSEEVQYDNRRHITFLFEGPRDAGHFDLLTPFQFPSHEPPPSTAPTLAPSARPSVAWTKIRVPQRRPTSPDPDPPSSSSSSGSGTEAPAGSDSECPSVGDMAWSLVTDAIGVLWTWATPWVDRDSPQPEPQTVGSSSSQASESETEVELASGRSSEVETEVERAVQAGMEAIFERLRQLEANIARTQASLRKVLKRKPHRSPACPKKKPKPAEECCRKPKRAESSCRKKKPKRKRGKPC